MRVIALIEHPGVIRRILEHSGWWAPLATEGRRICSGVLNHVRFIR